MLEIFLKMENHVTLDEMMVSIKKENISLNRDFVFETLEFLVQFGFATQLNFQGSETRYEHRHIGVHHDHMVCTKCGEIIEFVNEKLEKQQLKIAASLGFHVLQHKMEIYGICSKCFAHRTPLLSLSLAKTGEHLMVKKFEAGKTMELTIASMGLKKGDSIEIVSRIGGQVVIAVKENRLVIGRGMADKIMVRPFKTG